MLRMLNSDYQRYKQASFGEKNLRMLNTMFAVYTFWNVVRIASMPHSFERVEYSLIALGIAVTVIGIIYGVMLLLKLSLWQQYAILPLTIGGFILSDKHNPLHLFIVPAFVFVVLVLVELIVFVANKINRL